MVLAAPLLLALASCLEGENSIVYRNPVDLSKGFLPDTVDLNSTTQIALMASAPNSCWHSLNFVIEVESDTAYYIWAMGVFENHGESCVDEIVTKDTVINFTPTIEKSYVFKFLESNDKIKVDTIVVRPI